MITKDIVIELEHVYKQYRLYEKKADRIKEFLDPLSRDWHRQFTALKNISLRVEKGEVLGIVGKNRIREINAAESDFRYHASQLGKDAGERKYSTTDRTGAGFNPDFTGLENIYFYNSIQGFSKAETDAMLDDILNFAEIGDFIHQPLKVYSSGCVRDWHSPFRSISDRTY
jgi:ABC-type polysaccharide/polyol phosphate transport system ATPase subunit